MKLPNKSKEQKFNIEDYYALKISALWNGIKAEHLSFLGLCACFFFEYIRPQSIYPVMAIIPWSQIALLVTMVAAFFDRSVVWVSNIENKLFILFLFIVVLSGIFAFRPSDSWEYKDVMINWVLYYFLVITIVNSERRLFLFVLLYLIFNFKMSQHGFISWASRGFSFAGWGLIGSPGWFSNSGEYAIQMLIFVSLSTAFIYALKEKWGRYKRWFFYLLPFTGLMTIIGASSRGSQLGLAVIGLVLLIKSKIRIKVLFPLLVALLIVFYFLPEEQILRLTSMGEDKTSTYRITYWKYGLEVIQQHPLLGVGYNNWLSNLSYLFPDGLTSGKLQEPHNIYIQGGAELGVIGLICFITMAIFVFIINARTRSSAKKLDNKFMYFLSYGLDAGLLGYLVAGSFVSVLYYPFFWIQMGMTVALYTVTINLVIEKEDVKKSRFGVICS